MRLHPIFPATVATVLFCVLAACSDSATDTPSTSDGGALDAGTSKPLPSNSGTKKDPPPSGDDDDFTDDDDDITEPKDAGTDSSAPKDASKDAPALPKKYRVFVTKTRYTGNLKNAGSGIDGLEGADNLCTKAAADANLGAGTTWKAWVSTTKKNAGERIIDRSPWYLVDRATVAFQDFNGLSSPPLHEIDQNETGGISLTGTGVLTNRVWTGTTNGGVLTPGKNCNDWSDDTQGKGVAGAYVEPAGSTTAASWTRYAMQPDESCGKTWPIYCFEQ